MMDPIPAAQYGKFQSIEFVGWEAASGAMDSVDRLDVKWAVAALRLLVATLSLMLAPAVVAAISMVVER
jgi:hypothetical protein